MLVKVRVAALYVRVKVRPLIPVVSVIVARLSGLFESLGTAFSDCTSYEFDVIAAGTSGDPAYTVGYEHTTATVNGVPQSYTLRVTHVYRREDGEWKVVHRHADPSASATAGEVLQQLVSSSEPSQVRAPA